MSASRPVSPLRSTPPVPDDLWWLPGLTRFVAHSPEVPPGPQLLWVLQPPDDERREGPTLSFSALDPDDPVADLYGRVTPPEVPAVGFVGQTRARRVAEGRLDPAHRDGRLVHLVHRDGAEVRFLPGGRSVDGVLVPPTREPSPGPVGDTCRRMLGLPAAAPPPHTTDWWIDAWVELVLVVALHGTDPSWATLTELTGRSSPSTPADVAAALVSVGRAVPWATLHRDQLELARVHASAETACCCPPEVWPFGDPDVLAWMDAGTFARARRGEQPPLPVLLDTLDHVLAPTVADQVRAAVSMARAEVGGRPGG